MRYKLPLFLLLGLLAIGGGIFVASGQTASTIDTVDTASIAFIDGVASGNVAYVNGERFEGSWYDSAWSYRLSITIDADKIDSNLIDFPVYVDLFDLPSQFHSNVKTDGCDIRVTRGNGATEAPFEVVAYDSGSDTGELHFLANAVSSSTDSTFYIYYGNSGASCYATDAPYGAENVWTNGFVAVWHMDDDPTGTAPQLVDSTGNGYDGSSGGTMTAGDVVAGQVGEQTDFDGADDVYRLGSIASTDDLAMAGNDVTISGWLNYSSGDSYMRIFDKSDSGQAANGYQINLPNSGTFYGTTDSLAIEVDTTSAATPSGSFPVDTDTHFAAVIASSGWKAYKNGVSQTLTSTPTAQPPAVTTNAAIGSWNHSTGREYNGLLDEFRIANTARAAAWVAAAYENQSVPSNFYTVGGADFDNSWLYRLSLTIDADKIDSNLINFPVYVDLSDLPADFHSNVKTDGCDIRVTRGNGATEAPFEVVAYDSGSDTGELHFLANAVSSSTDSTFYIYYGNSGASCYATDAPYGAENVWSDYVAVYHLSDTGTATATDSTANAHDGTLTNGATYTTGKVGGGVEFDGDNDFIELGTIATGNPLQLDDTHFTLSVWLEPDGVGDGFQRIVDKSNGSQAVNGYVYALGSDPEGGFEAYIDGTVIDSGVGVTTANVWTRGTLVYDGGSNYSFYKDGAFVTAGTRSAPPTVETNMRIGSWNHSTGREFNGIVSDVRIAGIDFSADWLASEYTNQNSPTTFYTAGSQESN